MTLPASLLPELPSLLVIAEECHFLRAAERLNVSQPRISQVVRRIEDIVGYEIFVRRPRVRLTPAGELLVKAARQAFADLDLGLVRARDAATGRRGTVRLGYAPVAMMTKLPRLLKSFHERNPLIDLKLHTTFSANLWTSFEARQLDLIVSRETHERRGIGTHLFVTDGLVAVLPEDDPAAASGELRLESLASRDFIGSDEAIAPQWHAVIADLCRAAGFEPNIRQRTNDWGATLALVASGLGVSIVSSTLAQLSFPGIRFVPLKGAEHAGSFWIACHQRSQDPAVKLLFAELIGNSAAG